MGRIAGPYGLKGWLHVVEYTAAPGNLLDYSPWYLNRRNRWRPVERLDGRRHGKGLVVRLAGVDDREAAAALKGAEIGVYRDRLPVPGEQEYYWSDLTGLQVVTTAGKVLGTVHHLIETGANDVLVVRGEREVLVPFIRDQVIRAVDLAAGLIRVDWDPEY
ncbi:MAG: ribosome maturation factor RimM [Gammaproteobacteria bacterium]|jgi:16S rRNA processing protein RimM